MELDHIGTKRPSKTAVLVQSEPPTRRMTTDVACSEPGRAQSGCGWHGRRSCGRGVPSRSSGAGLSSCGALTVSVGRLWGQVLEARLRDPPRRGRLAGAPCMGRVSQPRCWRRLGGCRRRSPGHSLADRRRSSPLQPQGHRRDPRRRVPSLAPPRSRPQPLEVIGPVMPTWSPWRWWADNVSASLPHTVTVTQSGWSPTPPLSIARRSSHTALPLGV